MSRLVGIEFLLPLLLLRLVRGGCARRGMLLALSAGNRVLLRVFHLSALRQRYLVYIYACLSPMLLKCRV